MFVSTYNYTVDDKGRLSIPAKFREFLQHAKEQDAFYLMPGSHDAIWGYPTSRFNQVAESLADRPLNVEEQAHVRQLASQSEFCPIDKQGRMILPASLRNYAGIKRDVVIIGMLKRIEIWDPAKYAEHVKQNNSSPQELIDRMQGPKPVM